MDYLVKLEDGNVFQFGSFGFRAAMVDLTNPKAFDWLKRRLNESMVNVAGASGWMADFGEALPFSAGHTSCPWGDGMLLLATRTYMSSPRAM